MLFVHRRQQRSLGLPQLEPAGSMLSTTSFQPPATITGSDDSSLTNNFGANREDVGDQAAQIGGSAGVSCCGSPIGELDDGPIFALRAKG